MSNTILSPQQVRPQGIEPVFTPFPASPKGIEFLNNNVFLALFVRNNHATLARTIRVSIPRTVEGLTFEPLEISIPAGAVRPIRFNTQSYNQADGSLIVVAPSNHADLTAALIAL